MRLADSEVLRALYLEAEAEDGYHRDQNVFGPGVTIEDDMAVLVRYASGASLTYHLTAYSPWEGYRVAFNGSEGRLELLVEESTWIRSEVRTDGASPVMHGSAVGDEAGRTELLLRRFWEPAREVKVGSGEGAAEGGHGGGDVRMLADLFGRSVRCGGCPGAGRGRGRRGAVAGHRAGRQRVVRDRVACPGAGSAGRVRPATHG